MTVKVGTHPTKIGQRVQDIYADTRGWVVEVGERQGGEKVAVIDWDDKPVGSEDAVFPVEALHVVEVVRIDADMFEDPSLSPLVEHTTTGTEHGTVYKLKSGTVLKGIEQMRLYMLGYYTRDWA